VPVPAEHLRNEVTGEEIVFRKRAAETAGDLFEFDWCFPPGGSVPPHVHRRQEEAFEILSGRAWFRIGRHRSEAGAGERLAVAPGTVHAWGNRGAEEVWARIRISPALRTEGIFDALFALARDGRVDSRGRPSPLQMAAVLDEFREELQLPWLPVLVQRAFVAPLAAIARRSRAGSADAPGRA
jgi:quercetin dioxygenase-like cupin family protein